MKKIYAELVFDFVERVNTIETLVELNREFGKLCKTFGFTSWACLQISSAPGALREPLRRFFGNPPAKWLSRYQEANHIKRDPAAKEVLIRTNPFWWSEVPKEIKIETAQQVVFDEAQAFGLTHGLAIPIRFPDGSVWSCLLTSDNLDEDNDIKTAMYLAAQYYAGRGMYLRDTAPKLNEFKDRLTFRQKEIVELLSRGFKQRQIAQILGISHSTVFNMTNEAKERMGCRTVPELVAEAILTCEIEKSYKN